MISQCITLHNSQSIVTIASGIYIQMCILLTSALYLFTCTVYYVYTSYMTVLLQQKLYASFPLYQHVILYTEQNIDGVDKIDGFVCLLVCLYLLLR